jgi:phosphohistidine swiveling domain-containing protein
MDIIRPEDTHYAGDLGGKASGLIRLTEAGANVPPFVVIPPHVLTEYLPEREWEDFMREASDENAEALCLAISSVQFSTDFESRVREVIDSFSADTLFAIRSSMLGEDGTQFSFAGQLESFLFQKGIEGVCRSIRDCWCSAFQSRVLTYRARAGLVPQNIKVAVVVQKMVFSEIAGVLFTAHPQSGHRSRMLVSAAYGQGEGVVSGSCNADEIVWEKEEGILSYTIADKDRMVVRAEEIGVEEIDVPVARRMEQSISESSIQKLCVESQRLEEDFGYPLDIEWAEEEGKIYFLQARPITSLPEAPNEDGPIVVWDNSNIQESYCGVTTPLTFSYAQRAYDTVYRQTMEAIGVSQEDIISSASWRRNLLGIVRGRIFYNINSWYEGLSLLPSFGRNKEDMEEMMGLKDSVDFVHDQTYTAWEKICKAPRMVRNLARLYFSFRGLSKSVPAFQDHYEAIAKEVNSEHVKDMSFSELMALNEHLRLEIQEKWHIPIINDFYVMMSTGGLRRFLQKHGMEDALTLQNHLLAGEPGIESTEPTRILLGLTGRIRNNPILKDILFSEGDVIGALSKEDLELANSFSHYLHRYGDRVAGELKLETKTLHHDDSFLVQVLRNYVGNERLSLERLEEQEQKLRCAAEDRVMESLPFWSKGKAKRLMSRMREAVKNRENMRLTRTRAFGLSRMIYRALGMRLVEVGRLDDVEDIFYLTVEELEAYHEGRSISTNVRGMAALRRSEFSSYEDKDVPHHFTTRGAVYFGNRYRYSGTTVIDPDADILYGLGCYPGIVHAPISLIHHPDEAGDLAGTILCTVRTDPGWAPLFPSVSGILVERGSTLSHSAVVARELGIPAVVNIPGITTILKNGDVVSMDGDAGTVERKNTVEESDESL